MFWALKRPISFFFILSFCFSLYTLSSRTQAMKTPEWKRWNEQLVTISLIYSNLCTVCWLQMMYDCWLTFWQFRRSIVCLVDCHWKWLNGLDWFEWPWSKWKTTEEQDTKKRGKKHGPKFGESNKIFNSSVDRDCADDNLISCLNVTSELPSMITK